MPRLKDPIANSLGFNNLYRRRITSEPIPHRSHPRNRSVLTNSPYTDQANNPHTNTGGKCGSTTLDANFLKLLRGAYASKMAKWKPKATSRGSKLMDQFYNAKCIFAAESIQQNESWNIELTADEDFELTAQDLVLPRVDLEFA